MLLGIPIRRVPRLMIAGLALAASVLAIWTTQRLPAIRALLVVLLAGIVYAGVSLAAFAWADVWSDVGTVATALRSAGSSTVRSSTQSKSSRARPPRMRTAATDSLPELMRGGRPGSISRLGGAAGCRMWLMRGEKRRTIARALGL